MAATLSDTEYDIGDRVRLSTTVRDDAGDLVDPTTLTFTLKEPDATATTWTYGVDAEVVRDSIGAFHADWDTAQAGVHWSRFAASGNIGAAEERGFRVRVSRVL